MDAPTPRPYITNENYIDQLKQTADKFLADGASRADIKMVVTAVKELRYALKMFAPFRQRHKVTVFGSARIDPDHPSYEQAVELSQKLAEQDYMVVTGAANGIMEAGHVGAGKEKSIGVNILLPFEQASNRIIHGDEKLVHLKYFFTRKLMLVKESHGVAVFPGGFGTHDELFEILTLMQTGKAALIPVVLVEEPNGDYWHLWLRFVTEVLLPRGYICPWDVSFFKITQDVDEAVNTITRFYHTYHSMRYVGDHLVIRLKRKLSVTEVQYLNDRFADVLKEGTIEQTGAQPDEHQDTHLADLPRLKFIFNRQRLGRLRQMIDVINNN
ncbi:MAG: LOG family protein [Planctomycetia bacterium]|nr:LOG family protein [Planctomycetia bacterium]